MFSTILATLLLQASSVDAASAPPTPTPPPTSPPSACGAEEYSGFDFWVGEWSVYPNGDAANEVAHSTIERMSGGCTIRETWMPFNGSGGTSLSMVNHASGRWQQVWIGSDGRRVDFIGGVVDGKMILSGYWDDVGGPGNDALIRMTYTPQKDGSVRQFGQASTDHGLSWQTSFDFIYRPILKAEPGE